ncbi:MULTISPECIES: NO-inducible flavohemoprotein [unclassified Modicisalibacter]|uniref:NO-inducible flavohemoprotein n=1 Tax=unclassified Modicisalibacter TaxID=2679913 RepID=UPI001CD03AC7|nr:MULTISPECIES: NO-inducible flavohemoprotein [unclassified Modicisalibacter]MBZ9559012.1 NO-inducible flavohemoprotein [Modicisalibacter sp. R2A 31.J]MBZ9576876.1 NO-inducible flavohemoprotein [Modicisalibacter sp. MOD 31.J]
MLTPQQEQLVAATAPVVAEHLEAITARFYPLMFARYPEVKALFNAAHQATGSQPRALAGSVLRYVQLRGDREQAKAALALVVGKHVSLGIRPDQYPIVGECLMAAIGEVLGDAVTPEIADAWQAVYEELAGLLIELEAEAYAEFAGRPGGWSGTRVFRVAETRDESAEIRSFVLAPEDGGPVADFRGGQFIGVRLVLDGEPVYRHYSLSAAPNGRTYRLSIKREPGGRVSEYFHAHMGVGATLELLPPAGDLTLDEGREPVMLLSGGVGQTPMLSLANEALAQGREVTYVHAARDGSVHAFADELAALQARYPQQLRTVTLYESPRDDDAPDHVGRLDRELLARHLPSPEARCYMVGPYGFMRSVDEQLAELGVPGAQRRFETFGPTRQLSA